MPSALDSGTPQFLDGGGARPVSQGHVHARSRAAREPQTLNPKLQIANPKLSTAHYTLHTTHYTLQTTHFILHTTHYTLLPQP